MNPTMTPIDPVPAAALPVLTPVAGPVPGMPPAWSGVALLHPFSAPQGQDQHPDTPFFQLCVANVAYVAGHYLSAQIAGVDYGTWWYLVRPDGTSLSTDRGQTWRAVELGWSLPHDWFGAQTSSASCAGASKLNWMPGPTVHWWKAPVPGPSSGAKAATWMWFDAASAAPVRMMFGQGPATPVTGDPGQLALFQMFSMTYLPQFVARAPTQPPQWRDPTFAGFQKGNPAGYVNVEWDHNFGTTAFMTPVNEAYNPLATRVLYVWKQDEQYRQFTDRAQHTRMSYDYSQPNPASLDVQVALLTGPAPAAIVAAPPHSDSSYYISYSKTAQLAPTCATGGQFNFPQEPPDWISIPAVEAKIHATITNDPVIAAGHTVLVYGVLFPPSAPNYPDSTYLWTWYSPLPGSRGERARPVTFMQSQSGVGVGTSLALADYFYYETFREPIDPANFAIPPCCAKEGSGATKA